MAQEGTNVESPSGVCAELHQRTGRYFALQTAGHQLFCCFRQVRSNQDSFFPWLCCGVSTRLRPGSSFRVQKKERENEREELGGRCQRRHQTCQERCLPEADDGEVHSNPANQPKCFAAALGFVLERGTRPEFA